MQLRNIIYFKLKNQPQKQNYLKKKCYDQKSIQLEKRKQIVFGLGQYLKLKYKN